jgi:bifunctional ADP-heptose synthase (sugar kinase/adenylyltransferase)
VDTREKIIGPEDAQRLADGGATVVSGYFDPLLASHAERLAAIKESGSRLLVVIASPENPILPARARAELVAGLRAVDDVTEANIAPQIRLEQEDAARFESLLDHVRARQQALQQTRQETAAS